MTRVRMLLLSTAVFVFLLVVSTTFVYAEEIQTGIVTGDSVNLRESPNTSAEVLGQLSKGAQITISGSSDGWYKVSYGKLTGWLSNQYISVKKASADGVIVGDDVNLRSNPDTSAAVIAKLDKGQKVSVIVRSEDWYKVKTSDGKTGWVYESFISLSGSNVSRGLEALKPENTENGAAVGQKIVAYAKKFLGVRYVYGGITPKGFDCSGFVSYVYKNLGIDVERVAADQAKHGVKVSRANLQPGDLVFFDTDGGHNYINHVGIYIGNGNFIQASSGSSTHKVVISELSSGFYSNAFMTARRYVK